MAISNDMAYLVAATIDIHFSIVIFTLNKKKDSIKIKNDKNQILAICFNDNNEEFMTVGINHLKLWKINKNETISYNFANEEISQSITCC
jgi:hypothetical protein